MIYYCALINFIINAFLLIICGNCLETPIIGILTQENFLKNNPYPDAHSYLAASYVKYLESSGARILPIWIGQNEDYYRRVVNYTNGILFPGGGTYFNHSKGYGEAARIIYKIALKTNNNDYYPLIGICLGMEVLAFAATDGYDIRQNCSAESISLPLKFRKNIDQSRIFKHLPMDLYDKLQHENLTYNHHHYCLFESDMKENGLDDWRILSTNYDKNRIEFVSTMEHKTLPFYGLQYHPEKNSFEFKSKHVAHSIDAINYSQYLANFFVSECRKNNHSFPTLDLEWRSLIYNYNPVYSIYNTSYQQLYLFDENDYRNNQLL